MILMKKYIAAALVTFITVAAQAQLDRSKAPAGGPAPTIRIGQYESFTLKNGLKVFVVENHKLPVVAYNLVLDNDPVLEGDKAGFVDMVGELLTRGTKTRNKAQLDEEIDFIGANISASAYGMYATSLKKHNEKLLELMADILLNPSFPQDEFDKIKSLTLSGLAAEKNDPGSISSNLQSVLVYGSKHPYGEVTTEKTVGNITVDDIKGYYTKNFMPNVSYLAIVGDITKAEVQPLIEKYFGAWVKGTPVKTKYDMPKPPTTVNVHMHDRPGSVQASLSMVYPVQLKVGDADYIRVRMLDNILGGGSTGRLYKNLREGHGYTYGAYTSITADKLTGRFYAGAEVRNSVADSAIFQFIYEFNRISTQGMTQQEVDDSKKELTGTFARGLENPQTVANFAINIERYKLPKDYYETYLQNLNAITLDEMNEVAKKYVTPYFFHLIVVGARDSIERKILSYDADQKISFYDNYGQPTKQIKDAPAGVTAETVMNAYLTAIGGADAINGMKDITIKSTSDLQGMALSISEVYKTPDKSFELVTMGDQTLQKEVYNGKEGKTVGQDGGSKVMTTEELEQAKYDAFPIYEFLFSKQGGTVVLKGIEMVNDEDAYLMEYEYPNKHKIRAWYSTKTGLKLKEVNFVKTPDGVAALGTEFGDYRPVNGVMFPHMRKQELGPGFAIEIRVSSIQINTGVADDYFNVK